MNKKPDRGEMALQGRRRLPDPLIAAIAILVIMLLPFAVLSFFSHPQADDFDAATTTMRLGYFKAMEKVYESWNGRWFSTAVMLANPSATWMAG